MNAPLRQPIDEHDQNPGQHGAQGPRLEKYFQAMVRAEASDLHPQGGLASARSHQLRDSPHAGRTADRRGN